ncbi:hypothetical protein GCM10025768_21270 [Microbacterium pseudoresistens]|uniref:L,D-TPase catalytic domain-containing protein n=1 Tax=Microbacterium pseudoresistens TaxID=640634 RepID=A0A7Y9JN87_9MICO|nr:L,D-transpeptidase family protein [Microbacterium pseudoresistens]NYD53424.1 hypothetical protein [Microbacterium pseudoresistens]
MTDLATSPEAATGSTPVADRATGEEHATDMPAEHVEETLDETASEAPAEAEPAAQWPAESSIENAEDGASEAAETVSENESTDADDEEAATTPEAATTSVIGSADEAEAAATAPHGVGSDAEAETDASGADDTPTAQWAPVEPERKKRHVGRWIAVGVGALVLGAAAVSTILIAPGVTIAGIPVGGMTPGAAAEAVQHRLDDFQVNLSGPDGDATITGADLGANTDAEALADKAFDAHPMWNVTTWFPGSDEGEISLDEAQAKDALRTAAPSVYLDPVDATVSFDAASSAYVATPAERGTGIDQNTLTSTIADALAEGRSTVDVTAKASPVAPSISDATAKKAMDDLNGVIATAGFYVGAERTVPIDAATLASWLTVYDEDGSIEIDADSTAIQASVDALPGLVNRAPVNATTVVDSGGNVLSTIADGINGRELGDVSGLASTFARALEKGGAESGIAALPVTEVPFAVTPLVRTIDVDLANQTVTAIENGVAIDSWLVSSGRGEFATQTGHFTVNWKLSSQNMGNRDLTQAPFYFQPDVRWVMYFNGDEALHGVYWHDNWGVPMSHGCVGMPEWRAQWLYDWSPEGVEVNVHY